MIIDDEKTILKDMEDLKLVLPLIIENIKTIPFIETFLNYGK